ncbi:glycerophosphodiester phosphodiesterase [Actinocorallia longicatena]|uniref:Hydrolase n=1 Tax=Actinocorallia longicatena TaxID=111803 RepID=A0ABP6QKP2_9ACTN
MHRLGAVILASALVLVLPVPARAAVVPPAAGAPARLGGPVVSIAHRGASAYAPENTLASFRLAARMGADVTELDVQQTRDHKLVVVHDETLKRTTNVEKVYPKLKPWRVKDLTLKQIKKLDAGSWFGRTYKGERIPTLAQALRTVADSGTGMLLELKRPDLYPGMTDRVIATIKTDPRWRDSDRLTVQSFSWRYLKPVHERLRSARTAALGKPRADQLFGLRWYADAVHPDHRTVTPEYAREVHSQWMDLYAYTINDRATMRRMISYGVDGIVTNRPDVLARTLRRG